MEASQEQEPQGVPEPQQETPAPVEESATPEQVTPEQVADQPPVNPTPEGEPSSTEGATGSSSSPDSREGSEQQHSEVQDQAPAEEPSAAYDPPPTPAPAEAQHSQAPAHIVGGGSEVLSPGHIVQQGSPGVDVPPPVDNSLASSPQLQHLTTPIGGEGEGGGGSDAPTLGALPPPEGSDVLPPAGGPIH